jgi:predicted ATP-grasp superfamily ATP-dependent carboligase
MGKQLEVKGRTVRPAQVQTLLRSLADDESGAGEVTFRFDVRSGSYSALRCQETKEIPATGAISLAVYNEMKLSQYLVEDAEHSTPYERQFSLTDRGRHLANRRPN